MKNLIILTLVITSIGFVHGQTQVNKEKPTEKAQNNQELVHEIEKLKIIISNQEKQLEDLENRLESRIDTVDKKANSEIDRLDTKYSYYLVFGSLLIGLIAFLINFFGRQLIKERVEKLIQRTAFSYAQKVTNQVISKYIAEGKVEEAIEQNGQPAIEKIIKKLEREGFMAIDGIKTKGNEAISTMLASQKNTHPETSDLSTDEAIIQQNKNSQANEYFELAMSSKNPIVQISLYEKVLELEPNNADALNNLGVSFNNAYSYKKAIKALERSIEIAPKFALPYANLANSNNMLNNLDKALDYANKAIALNPSFDYPYTVKGNILTKKGDLKEAEATFNKAIALNPKSPDAYFTRGFFYEETNQYDKSEQDYFTAESLGFPNKAMLYNNLAVLHRRMKDFDTAISYLNKARQLNPEFPNLDGTLALIYADKKDKVNFYKHLVMSLDKGCPAWNYLSDSGFDDYRDDQKLNDLLESYKKKYVA